MDTLPQRFEDIPAESRVQGAAVVCLAFGYMLRGCAINPADSKLVDGLIEDVMEMPGVEPCPGYREIICQTVEQVWLHDQAPGVQPDNTGLAG